MLAALWLVFALRALLDGMTFNRSSRKERFNVGRLDAKRRTLRSMISTVGFVILAVIFLMVAILFPTEELVARYFPENPSLMPENGSDTPLQLTAVAETGGPALTDENGDALEGVALVETPIPPTETPTATPEPSPTPSPTPQVVFVNSPVVGLYMRDEPGGEILVLLEDQTPLVIQGESVSLDEIEWVEIATFDGQRGWVSRSFLTNVVPPTPVPENLDGENSG